MACMFSNQVRAAMSSVLTYLVFFAAFWCVTSVSTQAQLLVLVAEPANETVWVGTVDSATGTLTKGAVELEGCCQMASGLTAVDRNQKRLFAVGRFVSGDQQGEWALMNFSFDGTSVSTALPAMMPSALLAFDQSSGLLYSGAFSKNDNGMQWFSLDPETGLGAHLGDPNVNCCDVFTGQAQVANLGDSGRGLYFLGRSLVPDAGDTDWYLWVTDLATGGSSPLMSLPSGYPGFFRIDEAGEQLTFMMQSSPSEPLVFYEMDLTESTTNIQSTHVIDGCCWVGQGSVADLSPNQRAWWLGGSGSKTSELDVGYFSLFANTDSRSQFSQALDAGYQLHALMVIGDVVDLSGIFADRFHGVQ